MLRRIKIERFRGFESLDAALANATIVVGPNSSGKTTLLYAIRLALRALADGMAEGASRRAKEGAKLGWFEVVYDLLVPDHTRYLSVADWESLFYNQRTGTNQKLSVHLSYDESDPIVEIKVDIRCGNNAQLKLDVWIRAPQLVAQVEGLSVKSGAVNKAIGGFVERHAPHAVLIPSFYGVVNDEEYRAGVVVDRLLGAGDQSHIVRNLVARLSSQALVRLNAFLRDALGVELVDRTAASDSESVSPLIVKFRDEDGPLELSSAGAGLINLIALYTALERYRSEQQQRMVIFLLDEPEAHLHPRLQGEMAERVTSLIIGDFGSQVVMATHAVEIVNRLFLREDAAVLRVDRGQQRITTLRGQAEVVAELAEWADLTPFSLINFLAGRKLLFHEGDSDNVVLRRCAELRYRSAPRPLVLFQRWTLAPLHGSGNDKIVRVLERLVDAGGEVKLIPSLTDGKPLELLLVLDRDYEREPGMTHEESSQRVQVTRVVWPFHSIESLFLRPEILSSWLRARWGSDTPAELGTWIAEAVATANADEKLNEYAIGQLTAKTITYGLVDDQGKPLRGEQLSVRAHRRAVELVKADPARWQRGHDRSRVVLGRIRERLPHALRSQLPVNVHALLDTTSLDHFGEPERAIPPEIRELLDLMVGP